LGATDADRQAAYAAVFAGPLEADTVGQFRDATQRGWVLGSDRFQREIADTLKRRVTPPQRGRPRKAEDNNEP
jgi:putative transposase